VSGAASPLLSSTAGGAGWCHGCRGTRRKTANGARHRYAITRRVTRSCVSVLCMAGPSREQVRARDWDRCVRCGSSRDLHVHHRILRSQGGPDSYANLITLCAQCHGWVHAHPAQSYSRGYLLKSGWEPAQSAVTHFCWPGAGILLAEDGTIAFWSGDAPETDEGGFRPVPRR
jgi:5-methylcytosine-specific restriction endonuclease McrA